MANMIDTLKAEIEIQNRNYSLATDRLTHLIAEYAGRKPTTHFGHNLANAATELSMFAGKIEEAASILNYLETTTDVVR